MATTSRPPTPPLSGGGSGDLARRGAHSPITRSGAIAAAAIAAVLLALGYLIFLSGSGGAEYVLMFKSADGLVLGNQVQVGGAPVGTVKSIELTKDMRRARVVIEVESPLAPLHRGTTALIRVPSLSSVAARYVSLAPGPNNAPAIPAGGTLPTSATKEAVNLDEVFNLFTPKTRKGLQQVIEGFAQQYQGVGHQVNLSTEYFSPALLATGAVFKALVREEGVFSRFLVEAAKATTMLDAHKTQLGSLIRNGSQTFAAIGSEQRSLEEGLRELPQAFHEGSRSLAQVPAMVSALKRLVDVSKPNTKTLAPFFTRLRTLLREATPVVAELSAAIRKPGPNNDLTDFALAAPGLASSLRTASPDSVKSLNESVPITSFFGPYAPDLQGVFNDFGGSAGYYDAGGNYSRFSPDFAGFKLTSSGKLVPTSPEQGIEGLKTGQLQRCPGAATQPSADGSSPYTAEGKLGCNPKETP